MSEEPWIKPRKTYDQRRLDQVRTWFGQHRKTLPAQAEIAIAEVIAINEEQRSTITELLLELRSLKGEVLQLKGKDNPDGLHDSVQDGTRLELRSDRYYRRRRLEWEGQ